MIECVVIVDVLKTPRHPTTKGVGLGELIEQFKAVSQEGIDSDGSQALPYAVSDVVSWVASDETHRFGCADDAEDDVGQPRQVERESSLF